MHMRSLWLSMSPTRKAHASETRRPAVYMVCKSMRCAGWGQPSEQAGDFFSGQQLRLPGGHFGHGDGKEFALTPQHLLVQEARRAGGLIHGAVGQVALLDHVQQVGLDLLGCVFGGVAPVVFGHAVDGIGVALLGRVG